MNEMISIWKSQFSTNGHEQYSIQDFNQIDLQDRQYLKYKIN